MNTLFIAGIGNIGRRHLQAAFQCPQIKNIFCFDISNTTLDYLDEFSKQNNLDSTLIEKSNDLDYFSNHIENSSIVVVATTANDRKQLLSKIINRKPKAIIVEKPVCQNVNDYNEIIKLSKENNVKIYVNFIARAQNIYNSLLEEVSKSDSFTFNTKMPKWGISTVGIHQIDLFLWLSGIKNPKYSFLSKFEVYEQKRKGFFDAVGSIIIEGDKKSEAFISNFISDEGPSSIQFCLDKKTFTIYESLGKYTIADKDKVDIFDLKIKFVSQYMTEVFNLISEDKNCYLPDIEESFNSHEILFNFLEKNKQKELNIT